MTIPVPQPRYTIPMPEIAEAVEEAGGEALRNCFQCGTCAGVCPWGNLEDFSPRRLIEMTRLGFEGFEEQTWLCVACRRCAEMCPQDIEQPEIFRAVRNVLLEWRSNPAELNVTLGSLRSHGNPWGEPADKKESWADGRNVPRCEPAQEYALFGCCANEYDPRNRKVTVAITELLARAGVSYGYLGSQGTCCGDQAHSVGAAELSEELVEKNSAALRKLGSAPKVLITSPHCLNAFRQRYPKELNLEVRHVTELYADLLADGKLIPSEVRPRRVTYHDPCYLGRTNGIYEAPREVLRSIPGVELVELPNNRERSFCCGGGGGGAFLDRPAGERLGDLRVKEISETKAEEVITACPYCVQMLEASAMGLGMDDTIKVKTVSEVLHEAIFGGER